MSAKRTERLLRAMRNGVTWLCLSIGATVPALPCLAAQEQPGTRPNILIILSDDQGWNDVGYHNPDFITPHTDRLAAEGIRLNHFYVNPTCSPTRVALLTGRNPARYNVYGPLTSRTDVQPEDMHLPMALRDLGYRTHISGKWHLGETREHRPLRHGFDTSYGYLRGQIDPYTHRYKFGNHVTWHRNDEFIEERGHVTDLITDDAIRFIEEAADEPEPFFLYVAHHAPHFPLNESPKWIEPYEEIFDDHWRQHFAASITHLDYGVGHILEALERTGQRTNTLVIYASDNGGQQSWDAPKDQYNGRYAAHETLGDNPPLRGWKGTLYEGGIRVPAVVHWPDLLEGGRLIDAPIHMYDLAPTLIRLAGGEVESGWRLDGVDLTPLLKGVQEELEPRSIYWNHAGRQQALRHGDWKIVRHSDDRHELFHLGEDPYEERDVAGENRDHFERMRARLESERERVEN